MQYFRGNKFAVFRESIVLFFKISDIMTCSGGQAERHTANRFSKLDLPTLALPTTSNLYKLSLKRC